MSVRCTIYASINTHRYISDLNKKCSCRGSNPGPSAHKTEALPTAPQEHAPSGNRTRGTSLATRYFTTKPMALLCMPKRSRRDSNPQPPDSKSGALSIAPRDLSAESNCINSTDGFVAEWSKALDSSSSPSCGRGFESHRNHHFC